MRVKANYFAFTLFLTGVIAGVSDKVFVSADKSRHLHKLGQSEYKKMLKENITQTYKKSDRRKVNNVNSHAKRITKNLSIWERIEKLQETEIKIKNHKEDFPNKISCRLINPLKSSIGKIRKLILDKINQQMQLIKKVNEWKDTSSVIERFNNFKNKEVFIPQLAGICLLKPSSLLNKEPKSLMKIIIQWRHTMGKREGNDGFDVPMGCFDGALVCQLAGSFILQQFSQLFEHHSIGLDRDHGLAIFKGLSVPETERVKK